MKKTIYEQILFIHDQDPDRTFVTFHGTKKTPQSITYRDLLQNSLIYTQFLKGKFSDADNSIIIMTSLGPDLFYAFFGSIFANQIPSIFAINSSRQDPELFQKSMESLIQISETKLIFTNEENVTNLQLLKNLIDVIPPLKLGENIFNKDLYPIVINPTDIAFLQHSSGTTGLKKGVALTHQEVMNQIQHLSDCLELTQNDRIAAWVPVYHDMGLIASLILPLLTGTPLEIMDAFDWVANPDLLLNVLSQTKSTLCWQPNFAYIFLADRVQEKKFLQST